jgi:hypothetical protein
MHARLSGTSSLAAKRRYWSRPVSNRPHAEAPADDHDQFPWWALALVQANPRGGEAGCRQDQKGSGPGSDGVITFLADAQGANRVAVQVQQSGKVSNRLTLVAARYAHRMRRVAP